MTSNTKANNYAISFFGGHFKVRDKPDSCLWCIDSSCRLCVIVLPEPSSKLLDSLVTEYSTKNQVAATMGCIGLDTEEPVFMPVVMSLDTYINLFTPLSEFITNRVSPPRELAEPLLNNIEFIERDDFKQTIKLRRQTKNLTKGDLFTTDKFGNRIEVYVTQLLKTDKPYSIGELYRLKLRHLFKL